MTADPMAVIAALHAAGLPVLAVADHDDVALRKRALAAGASKVLAYRKLHDDGPARYRRLDASPGGRPDDDGRRQQPSPRPDSRERMVGRAGCDARSRCGGAPHRGRPAAPLADGLRRACPSSA